MSKLASLILSVFASSVIIRDARFTIGISPIDTLRVLFLRLSGSKIAQNAYIRSNFYITYPQFFRLGSNSGIARNGSLYLYSELTIGNYVQIGSNFTVHTTEHNLVGDSTTPLICRGSTPAPVRIMDNVYIGSNVTILSGVTICSNVVVAAGAVVVSDLASGFVYGGIPAKQIRRLH